MDFIDVTIFTVLDKTPHWGYASMTQPMEKSGVVYGRKQLCFFSNPINPINQKKLK